MSTCRAKNPAVCRTHGFRVRSELFGGAGSVKDVFGRMRPTALNASRALAVLENHNDKYLPETLKTAQAVLTQTIRKHTERTGEYTLSSEQIARVFDSFQRQTMHTVEAGNLENDLTYEEVAAADRKSKLRQPAHYTKPLPQDYYDPDEDDTIRFERNPRTGMDEVYRD